jgi:hypothetical protein
MTEKHGSPIESLGDDRKERVQGFEDSRGQVEKDRRQNTEYRIQRTESSTTLSFPHAFSGNPEDVMVPR